MREKILVMGGPELAARVRRALVPLRVQVRPVPPEEYSHSLGFLAGDKNCPRSDTPGTGPALDPPMLVLAGFEEQRLERALWYLNREGVAVDCKAVLTPTNRQWDVPALYAELRREHAALHRQDGGQP